MLVFNLTFIKSRRNHLKKTLQDMALELGMKNASTYMKYEKGEYAFKAEILPNLSNSLECEITDFFTQNVAEIENNECVS